MSRYSALAIWTLGVSWSLTVLGLCSVLCLILHPIRARPNLDTCLVIVAFAISTVLVGLSTWAIVDEGQGLHQKKISTSQLEHMAKSLLVSEALWGIANGLIRISACLFMSKILGNYRPKALYEILYALCGALAGASLLQVFLMCRPLSASWDPNATGECGNQLVSFMVFESLGLALDIAILVLSVLPVIRLSIPLGERLSVIFLLNVGSVVLVITGLRMRVLYDAVSPDFSYSQSYLSLLSAVGTMASVVCCAVPVIFSFINGRRQSRRDRKDEATAQACAGPDYMERSTTASMVGSSFSHEE